MKVFTAVQGSMTETWQIRGVRLQCHRSRYPDQRGATEDGTCKAEGVGASYLGQQGEMKAQVRTARQDAYKSHKGVSTKCRSLPRASAEHSGL